MRLSHVAFYFYPFPPPQIPRKRKKNDLTQEAVVDQFAKESFGRFGGTFFDISSFRAKFDVGTCHFL